MKALLTFYNTNDQEDFITKVSNDGLDPYAFDCSDGQTILMYHRIKVFL